MKKQNEFARIQEQIKANEKRDHNKLIVKQCRDKIIAAAGIERKEKKQAQIHEHVKRTEHGAASDIERNNLRIQEQIKAIEKRVMTC